MFQSTQNFGQTEDMIIRNCLFLLENNQQKNRIKWDLGKVLFLGTPSYGGRFSDASRRMRRALKAAERQKCDATEIDRSDALCNQQAIFIWVLIAKRH